MNSDTQQSCLGLTATVHWFLVIVVLQKKMK